MRRRVQRERGEVSEQRTSAEWSSVVASDGDGRGGRLARDAASGPVVDGRSRPLSVSLRSRRAVVVRRARVE